MNWYCSKCNKIHADEEMCPRVAEQLKKHPEWIASAADFINIAGQEVLVTSQALDGVAQGLNKLVGTSLSYEGTQQFARDIQVFNRINVEVARSGQFASPENAKNYIENALKMGETNPKVWTGTESKFLTGTSQEVDWLRMKKGQISSLWEKSELLNKNAPGVDGTTVNRFTGKQISRTTVKASINTVDKNSKAIEDVKKAIDKGYASNDDILFGPKGTAEAAKEAGLKNPVVEKNTPEQIKKSNERLKNKILDGQATTKPTLEQVGKKMGQGAIVGAAVSLTVSSITSYVRYKNGEIDMKEAFSNISEETLKGALVGGALAGVTIFLPGGVIGFVAGVAIGIYVSSLCGNVLDEIYGKGAFGAILDSSGYVYGMTFNLAEYYERIKKNNETTQKNIAQATIIQSEIDSNFDLFENMKRGY